MDGRRWRFVNITACTCTCTFVEFLGETENPWTSSVLLLYEYRWQSHLPKEHRMMLVWIDGGSSGGFCDARWPIGKMYRDVHVCYRVMSVFGIVLSAAISTNHRATGFSSFRPIDPPSDSIRTSKIGCWSSLWCVFEKTHEDYKPAFSQTENVVDVGTIGPPPAVVPVRRRRKISTAASENFERRFLELLAFKESHGHTRVPRRQGKLGDWVNKLRQRKDRLDEQRLGRLNEIGFCWDASDDKLRKQKERWWERLESLRIHQRQNQSSVLLHESLTNSEKKWLRRQQLQYFDSDRKPSLKLDERQMQALRSIDPKWWQTVCRSWLYGCLENILFFREELFAGT